MKRLFAAFLTLLASGLFQTSDASIKATGEFTANQECPAYLSKNRKTNPDASHLTPGRRYAIIELNKSDRPDWIRLTITEANPPARWVSTKCGDAKFNTDSGHRCATPGLADSYILALSWQPAFCESHRQKRECQEEEADYLTLHGLWPSRAACGKNYGYCGPFSREEAPRRLCDYPPLSLSPSTFNRLKQEMPSARHGTCLQRHQWYKHGTCQRRRSADDYFNLALELLRQVETSAVGRFLKTHAGEEVETNHFLEIVDQTFGQGAHRRLTLRCHQGRLVELYIRLPREITPTPSLNTLLHQASPHFSNQCGRHFFIDETGPSRSP